MAKAGTAEFDVEISRAKVAREVAAAGKEIETGLGASARKVNAEFSSMARNAAGAFAVYKTGQFIGDSIKAASDLSEQQNKVNVVFGDSADVVNKFAANSAEALGQSKQQALAASGTFGNLFRAIGLADDQSAKFSTTLVGLASDVASFNNASPAEVLQAFQSGLVGETEPLKRFGVNLNEATLKAKAMELGLSDGIGVLSASAKAQAAYALILEQTKTAQGDFARTGDGLANQQRKLAAEYEDVKASLGESLLPVMKTTVAVAGDMVKVFSALPGPVQTGVVVVGGLTFAVGLLGPTLVTGAKALIGLGAAGIKAGVDLIVPTAAVETLGAAEVTTTVATKGLTASMNALVQAEGAAALGAAGVAGALAPVVLAAAAAYQALKDVDGAGRGGFVGNLRKSLDERGGFLSATNADITKAAKSLDNLGASSADVIKFTDGNTASIRQMRDAASDAGYSTKSYDQALREVEKATARADQRTKEYGGSTKDATGAVTDEVKTLDELTKAHDEAVKAAQGNYDQARDLFAAKRAEADSSEALAQAVADEATARRAAAGDSDEYRAAQVAIVDAQKAVTDATKQTRDAVSALTDAREQARRSLRDERLDNERAILTAQRAAISLADAKDKLGAVQDDPRATDRQKLSAALDLKDAELSLQEAQNRRGDSAADLAKAEQKGIEGSDAVTAAKERVIAASDSQREAEGRLADATKAASKILVKAQADVKVAQDKVTDAVLDEADARRAVAEKTGDASLANDAYIESLKRSMGLLDPNSPFRKNLADYITDLERLAGLTNAAGALPSGDVPRTADGQPIGGPRPYDPNNAATNPYSGSPQGPPSPGSQKPGGGKSITINMRNGATAAEVGHELAFPGGN